MSTRIDIVWLSGGRVAGVLIALVSLRVSTMALPPEQYGLLSVLATFQVLCGLFLVNPIGQYINRHTHQWADDGSLSARLSRYRNYVAVIATIGAIATCVWTWSQGISTLEAFSLMAAVGAMVIASTWNATSVTLLNMLGFRAESVAWATATAGVSLMSSWICVSVVPSGLAWFCGQTFGMAVGAYGAGRVLAKRLPPAVAMRMSLIEAGALRQYILPLAVATGFMWVQISGYRLLIGEQWGLAALGLAAVGLGLASQLWSVCESLAMQFLIPLYYRRIAENDAVNGTIAFSSLINVLGPVYLVLAASTVTAASALTTLLLAEAYAETSHFLLLGACVECCRVLANVLGNAAQVNRRMRALIWPYAIGALVLLSVLAIGAIVGLPLQQAINALPVASVIMLAVMFLQMRRELRFVLDLPRWSAAGTIVLVGLAWAWLAPPHVGTQGEAFLLIACVGFVGSLFILALLWRNPALEELTRVQLSTIKK